MRFDILTLFPDMVKAPLEDSIIKRAVDKQLLEIHYHNIRDFSKDKHRKVDDEPYGGGKGMVMQPQPIFDGYSFVKEQIGEKPYVVFASPSGNLLNQNKVKKLSEHKNITIICGHYEGIDQRIIDEIADEEISIGDYVLTGGELAACVIVDSVSRMIKGVLSDEECFKKESHFNGFLEHPQYTRPFEYHNMTVPDVLVSGHHKNIEKWQREKSLEKTLKVRPELLEKTELTKEDKKFLEKLKSEGSF